MKNLIFFTLIVTLLYGCSSKKKSLNEEFTGGWIEPEGKVLIDIGRVLVSHNIKNAASYYYKKNDSEYLIVCTSNPVSTNRLDWDFYLVFPLINEMNSLNAGEIAEVVIPTDSTFIDDFRKREQFAKEEEYKEEKYWKSKAGRINKKYPEWSREDCELISNNRIWIGMHYNMLVYQRGQYNHINTSNYGDGNRYQMCWDDYNPGCIYCGEDGIVTSYN